MPTYVTQQDIVHEKAVAKRFAALIPNAKAKGMPEGHPYDTEIYVDGKLVCICESKHRGGLETRYPTYDISKKKLARCHEESIAFKVPFFVIFEWDNGAHYWRFDPAVFATLRTYVGGRRDRNDPKDIEPMVQIPRSFFKRIP